MLELNPYAVVYNIWVVLVCWLLWGFFKLGFCFWFQSNANHFMVSCSPVLRHFSKYLQNVVLLLQNMVV